MWLINKFVRIVIIIFTIGMVFVLHEYGHLREFQKLGVPVEEFSIGIGPVIYKYQTGNDMTVSLRVIPLMAYVKPTEEGNKDFEATANGGEKLSVALAGIRNHLMIVFLGLFSLQFIGCLRGNMSGHRLLWQIFMTPIKLVQRAGAFYIGCFTLGRVNLVDKSLLPTGKVDPPAWVSMFIILNIGFAFLNVVPAPGFDGYRVLLALNLISESFSSELPRWLSGALVGGLIYTANIQDLRMFETQAKVLY